MIQQIREKGCHLLGQKHAFVNDRTGRQRTDVKIIDQILHDRFFDAVTHQKKLSFRLFFAHISRHREHDLFNFRAGCDGLLSQGGDINRHLTPAINEMPKGQNFFFNNTATAFLCGQIRARQKHHTHSQPPIIIIMPGAGDMLDEEITRYFDMDTRPIAGSAVGINSAAVPDRLQGLDSGLDNRTPRLAITGRNKPNAAGIMFHLCTIGTCRL